jgi:hypothetical protein
MDQRSSIALPIEATPEKKRCGFKALGERSIVPHRPWVSLTFVDGLGSETRRLGKEKHSQGGTAQSVQYCTLWKELVLPHSGHDNEHDSEIS